MHSTDSWVINSFKMCIYCLMAAKKKRKKTPNNPNLYSCWYFREEQRAMLYLMNLVSRCLFPAKDQHQLPANIATYISGHLKKPWPLPPAPSCLFALALLSMCGSASRDIKKKVGNYQRPIPMSPPPSPCTSPRSTCRTFGHWTLNSFLVCDLNECKAQA